MIYKILQAVILLSKLYLSIRTEELSAACTCASAVKVDAADQTVVYHKYMTITSNVSLCEVM